MARPVRPWWMAEDPAADPFGLADPAAPGAALPPRVWGPWMATAVAGGIGVAVLTGMRHVLPWFYAIWPAILLPVFGFSTLVLWTGALPAPLRPRAADTPHRAPDAPGPR